MCTSMIAPTVVKISNPLSKPDYVCCTSFVLLVQVCTRTLIGFMHDDGGVASPRHVLIENRIEKALKVVVHT